MSFGTLFQTDMNYMIDEVGNTASLYSFSSATTSSDDEGDVTVSDWGTATTISVADTTNLKSEIINMTGGIETIGNDFKVVKQSVTVAIRDRITIDSVEYEVVGLQPLRANGVAVGVIIQIERRHSTSPW